MSREALLDECPCNTVWPLELFTGSTHDFGLNVQFTILILSVSARVNDPELPRDVR